MEDDGGRSAGGVGLLALREFQKQLVDECDFCPDEKTDCMSLEKWTRDPVCVQTHHSRTVKTRKEPPWNWELLEERQLTLS